MIQFYDKLPSAKVKKSDMRPQRSCSDQDKDHATILKADMILLK